MDAPDLRQIISDMKNLKEFSRKTGVGYQTLMDIKRGRTKQNNISVGVFIKIAHGLDMTADELLYGKDIARRYTDPRQALLNRSYSTLSDDGKDAAAAAVSGMADAHIKKATPDVSGVVRKSVR